MIITTDYAKSWAMSTPAIQAEEPVALHSRRQRPRHSAPP